MNVENTRTCLVCGARFPATKEFCPVCMLREALDEEIKPAKTFLKVSAPIGAATACLVGSTTMNLWSARMVSRSS